MTIILDGYQFGTNNGETLHGDVVAPDFDFKESVNTYWGLTGGTVNYSPPETRILTIDVTIRGFTTQTLLLQSIAVLRSRITRLGGTLTVDGIAWPQCAFIGFDTKGPQFFDGSGYHGWCRQGTLKFRQIAF